MEGCLIGFVEALNRTYSLNNLDNLAYFGHERIPEHAVHVRGAGARGYFEYKTARIARLECPEHGVLQSDNSIIHHA